VANLSYKENVHIKGRRRSTLNSEKSSGRREYLLQSREEEEGTPVPSY